MSAKLQSEVAKKTFVEKVRDNKGLLFGKFNEQGVNAKLKEAKWLSLAFKAKRRPVSG